MGHHLRAANKQTGGGYVRMYDSMAASVEKQNESLLKTTNTDWHIYDRE